MFKPFNLNCIFILGKFIVPLDVESKSCLPINDLLFDLGLFI